MKRLSDNALLGLLQVLMLPIILLNTVGGLVGGIWLLLNGNALLVLVGLGFLLFETWVLSIFLMPGLGLAVLGAKLIEKNHRYTGYLLMALNWVYSVIFILLASYYIFDIVLQNWQKGSIIPVLLLAYTLVAGPWTYMASNEPETPGYSASLTAVFFIDIGVIGTMIMLYRGGSLASSFMPMRISMLLLLIVQIAVMFTLSKRERKNVAAWESLL